MSYQKGELIKKPNGTFMLRYRIRDASRHGGWRKEALTLEATTEKAAEKERDRKMEEVNGRNDQPVQRSLKADISVEGFSESSEWLMYLDNRGVAASTRRSYASMFKLHIIPIIGSKKLAEVTPADISGVLHNIKVTKPNASPKSLLNVYGLLRTMFAVAEENDVIDRSPVRKKLHRPIHEQREKPAWSAEQVALILANIPETWKAFFWCLALTTVRIGELLALQWQDVDFEAKKIRVSKTIDQGVIVPHTKTRRDSLRHIHAALFALLQRHRELSAHRKLHDLVFCEADGSVCDPDEIRDTVLYPAVDRAGIQRLPRECGFHAFRHAGSTIINDETGDLKLSQVQLGHKRVTTTANIYTHTNIKHVERAGEVLANTILAAHQMSTKTPVGCPPAPEAINDAS